MQSKQLQETTQEQETATAETVAPIIELDEQELAQVAGGPQISNV